MSEVMAIGAWGNNARMIESAAQLGYLPGRVLDLTYGEGKFWSKFRPEEFVTNDRFKDADHHEDFRATSFEEQSFDAVVFDPPYKLAGKRADAGQSDGDMTMDGRYGTGGEYVPPTDVRELLIQGTQEACRLSRQFVLVKCMDQVACGRVHWQTDDVTVAALEAGFFKKDLLMLKRNRAQDPNRRQLHARRNYSTLLIFKRK